MGTSRNPNAAADRGEFNNPGRLFEIQKMNNLRGAVSIHQILGRVSITASRSAENAQQSRDFTSEFGRRRNFPSPEERRQAAHVEQDRRPVQRAFAPVHGQKAFMLDAQVCAGVEQWIGIEQAERFQSVPPAIQVRITTLIVLQAVKPCQELGGIGNPGLQNAKAGHRAIGIQPIGLFDAISSVETESAIPGLPAEV